MEELHTLLIPGDFVSARFLLRINRFVAKVEAGGKSYDAHVPTSGRLAELLLPGAEIVVRAARGDKRRTAFDLMLVSTGDTLVSLDSRLPNLLVGKLLKEGRLPPFGQVTGIKAEFSHAQGRLDFAFFDQQGQQTLLEVKSVTLVEDGRALFPDAPTLRGARHLRELTEAMALGYRAGVIFIIQRDDASIFSPNRRTDPAFAQALGDAAAAGVEVYAWRCRADVNRLTLLDRIEVDLEGGD